MKTRRAVIPISIAVLLCIVVIVAVGCGASGMAYMGDPMALFSQAQENISTASSFRMKGEISAEYSIPPETGSQNQRIDMLFEKKTEGDSLSKFKMEISGEGPYWTSDMPDTVEMRGYIAGERMYIQDPYTGDWYYEEQGLGESVSGFMQSVSATTPQQVKDMIDASKNVEVIEENEDAIAYDLTLDPDKYLGGSLEEEVVEEFRQQGASEEEIDGYLQAVRNLFSTLEIVIEVEKRSGQISRFSFSSDENMLETLSPMFTDEPLPEGASMTMYLDFRFSDYGGRFDLELPPETKAAVPLGDSEE